MIGLFLLIFAIQNVATEEANLRQLVESLQMNMNEISTKMTTFETKVESMENEIKVRVDLKKSLHQKLSCEIWNLVKSWNLRTTPIQHLKSKNENLESIVEMKETEELVLIS